MPDDATRSYLERAEGAPSAAREAVSTATGFLDPVQRPPGADHPPAAPPSPAPAAKPEVSAATIGPTLDALVTLDGASTLEMLFPGEDRAALMRNPRSQRQVEERLAEVEAHLTLADRDGGANFKRDRVKKARAALDRTLARMGDRDGIAHAAATELRARQTERLRAEIERHGAVDPTTGARTRRLYGSDLLKVDDEARRHGFSAEEGRAVALAAGFELLVTEAHQWTPLASLQGTPTTLDAATDALLRLPAAGAEVIRRGEVSLWLASNKVDPAVVDRVKAIEQQLRANVAAPTLAVHGVAWALGRLELLFGDARLRHPSALTTLLVRDPNAFGDLEPLARAEVLSAWLQWYGQPVAARFAEQYGRALRTPGAAVDAEALAWSLGVPLTLAGVALRDVRELADLVARSEAAQREALQFARQGRLVTWLESLPPAKTDVAWQRSLVDPEFVQLGPAVAFWFGVHRNASDGALVVHREGGTTDTVDDLDHLRDATRVAPLWDGLKASARGGRLFGWLFHRDFTSARRWLSTPTARSNDPDIRLNGLLWSLGARGMVVEWGERDRAVNAPADLVILYREDPLRLNEQVQKGYPLDWLEMHAAEVETLDPGAWRRALGHLRAMVGRAPAGHLALGTALLAGLGTLPLDPLQPQGPYGAATGVRPLNEGEAPAAAWGPLAEHVRSGVALLWLLTGRHGAFATARMRASDVERADTPETRVWALSALVGAPVFGDPRASSSPSFAPTPNPSFQGFAPAPPRTTTPIPLPPIDTRRAPKPATAPPAGLFVVGALVAVAGAVYFYNRPVRPAARDAGVIAPPPPARVRMCAVTSGVPVTIGRAGDTNTGLRVSWTDDEVAVGWRVPRMRRYGPDDSAVARLDRNGSLLGMHDGEEPSRDNPADWSPRTVQRVQPVYEGGALRTYVNEVLRTVDSESVRCGDFSSAWWVARGTPSATEEGAAPEAEALPLFGPLPLSSKVRAEEMTAAFYCRTLSSAHPFTLAAHANVGPDGGFAPNISLVVTRGAAVADARPLVELHAPRSVTRAAADSSPLAALRGNASPSGALAVDVPGRGSALTFHYGHSLYFAWLDTALNVVGTVQVLEVANTSHDPNLGVKGDAVVMVYADHPSRRDDRSPVAVYARRAAFGAPLGVASRLDTAPDVGGSEVNPAVAPLPSGWVVTWSLRVPASGDPATRSLWMRSYGDDLRPEGPAVRLLDGGAESVVVTRAERFVVAAMAGRGEHAPVQCFAGDCSLREAPAAPSPTTTPAPAAAGSALTPVAAAWGATADAWERQVGQRLRFDCPANGGDAAVVGSEPYATMSSVCEAAVHAGLIQRPAGGSVTIVVGERLRRFDHSSRNGVSTRYSNRRRGSFTFVR